MIERTRPYPDADELAALYAVPNDADRWPEHQLRTDITVALGRSRFPARRLIIDPAAGTGRAARELADAHRRAITGDLSPDARVDHPATSALELLDNVVPFAGLYSGRATAVVLLGEILEHVEDPAALLAAAHRVADGLILSTPLDEPAGVNPEHVWRWDRAGILELLAGAGWAPDGYVELELETPHWPPGYRCQIHTAKAVR